MGLNAWYVAPCLLLLSRYPAWAGDEPQGPPSSIEEGRARAIVGNDLRFERYVFDGPEFPRVDFERPEEARRFLGAYAIRATYYDRDLRTVDSAVAPGPYAAVVVADPEVGRPITRHATLFRTPSRLEGDWRPDPSAPDELALRLGVTFSAVSRQGSGVGETLKGRPVSEWSADPRAGRLAAGLALSGDGAGVARPFDDAFAMERQWWVALKRRWSGQDRRYAEPFVGPLPVEGPPAPVLRVGSAVEAGMRADAAERIDAACRAWAADSDEAFAVCVARRGVIILHRAYGQRDGRPMTVETKSWMASITKPMSATLMMMLVDRGLVDLDDPIDEYLPELRGLQVRRPLTIRHLYTHTNGLERWPGWDDERPDLAWRVADYYPLLRVGRGWAYNGVGYELGGKVVEAVSGEAVPQFFERHLLRPLGCVHTDVRGTHADARSVPLDIARFGQMLLNRGAYGPLRFFREETFERMLPRRLTEVLGPDATKTFGIGLDGAGPERFGHGAASAATFRVDAADDLVVVMTRNAIGRGYDRHNGRFWQAIRDGIAR